MSVPWRVLLAVLLGAAAGCNQGALPGQGGLNGVNSVAVVRLPGWDGGLYDGGTLVNALYGETAFIMSSNTNDLKGLDLVVTDPSQVRSYVPAPNPLQPLSIPTVDHPAELATSVRYGRIITQQPFFPTGYMDGQVVTGMLLFVRGSASTNISVVGAANVPESLRQLTNGLLVQSAGVVTALSARLTNDEQNVVLYYATFDGQDGTVWERVFQHPPISSPSFSPPFPTSLTPLLDCSGQPPVLPSTTLYVCPPRAVRTYQNSSISALQVLPTLPTDLPLPVLGGVEGGRLAVALRLLIPPLSDPSLSNAGEVRIINPAVTSDLSADGTSTDPLFRIARFFAPFDHPQPPLIPNAPLQPPVRQLLTHPRAYNVVPDGGTPPGPPVLAQEGARLFGVLDESSCNGSVACTGILAIDALPFLVDGGVNSNYGLLAFDNSDCLEGDPSLGTQYCANIIGSTNRMLPMRLGTGIIQGVALESSVSLPSPTSFNQGLIPLLGIATVSAESLDHTAPQIYFFDAVGLRVLNENFGPGISNGISLVVPSLGSVSTDGGANGTIPFITLSVGVGLYPRSEIIRIINQGEIPGLIGIHGIPYDAGFLADGSVAPVFAWPVPDAGRLIAASVLEQNDYLYPVNLSGTLCTVNLGQGPVQPRVLVLGVDDGGTSIFTSSFDLTLCPGASGYIATTGDTSQDPFLVTSPSLGILGRMQSGPATGGLGPVLQVPNAITEALGLTFPRFFDPNVDAGVVIPPDGGPVAGVASFPLTLQMPYPQAEFLFFPQAAYTFEISNGFQPASMPIDTVGLGYAGLFLPGGVAQTRVIDANGEFVLAIIAYPSSNTVIDFIPAQIILGTPNSSSITVHF